MSAAALCLVLWLLIAGCSSYERFVQTLNDRNVSSCIQGDLALHGGYGAGSASGALRVYTATGGADLSTCLRLFRHGEVLGPGVPAVVYPATPVP